MTEAREVTATFTKTSYSLTVSKDGNGSGSVSSVPAGIDCGSTCEGMFSHGTVVTLTATADSGSAFKGWSGACTNASGPCEVIMNAAREVTATFETLNIYLPFILSNSKQ
jgi:hypothetical protein